MLAATLVSCATAKNAVPEKAKAVLVKEDSRMLWSINGTDRNGNPSKIYVQGTFHIADGRCYPVSDLVEEAFFSADRIFGEISGEGNIELNIRMPSIYEESMARANGRLLSDNLSDEDVLLLIQLAGEDVFNTLNQFEPWVLTEEYEKVLIFDRNEKWAGIFEDILEEGGTTFVYAGTLHFVGDHSVFKHMEENGTLIIE
ncbi:MAG: TraB/GumN family protein [Treponema sp.]|nr:TraB/GumN family protein [Candidatus Treponema caballi]